LGRISGSTLRGDGGGAHSLAPRRLSGHGRGGQAQSGGGQQAATVDGHSGSPSPGAQSGGAISKWSKTKAGATVQVTSVQSPSERAACQAPAGTTAWGRCPAFRSAPRTWRTGAAPPAVAIISSSGPPLLKLHT